MTFKARVFIQGAGCYVPHVDRDKLLVLFPRHDHDRVGDLAVPHTGDVCDHDFVVQFDASCLKPDLPPNLWLSLDVTDRWVGFDSDSRKRMNLPNGTVPGLFVMQEILSDVGLGDHAALNEDLLPGRSPDAGLLSGGFYADRGQVGVDLRFQGDFRLQKRAGGPIPRPRATVGSVVEIDLGEVSTFELKLANLDGSACETVPLQPISRDSGSLDIWVRHYCDLSPPDPDSGRMEPGDRDVDFVLAYLLRRDLSVLLQRDNLDRLPVPVVAERERGDEREGGDPRRCMGPLEEPLAFSSPFGS